MRTDLEGIDAVSAVIRVDVDPGILALGFGGVLEASAFLCWGLVALGHLRARRRGRRLASAGLALDRPRAGEG